MADDDDDPGADLVAALDLERVDEARWAAPATPWSGPAPGGLLVGQVVVASVRARPERRPWCAQIVFARPVVPGPPCTFALDAIHDGRAVTTGRVTVTQADEIRAVALVTLGEDTRAADAGPERHRRPPVAPPPEAGVDWEDLRMESGPSARRPSPVEVRVARDPVLDDGTTRSYAWLRPRPPLPREPALHAGALAFATDLTLLRSVARPERSPFDLGRAVTLNHTVWFHRTHEWSDWLLYSTSCATASEGRALATGTLFAGETTIATTAQDGLTLW